MTAADTAAPATSPETVLSGVELLSKKPDVVADGAIVKDAHIDVFRNNSGFISITKSANI